MVYLEWFIPNGNEQGVNSENSKIVKIHRDPRQKKLRDFRKGINGVHFDKESKPYRKPHYRAYRKKMKRLIRNKQYDLIHKYQRTSGWLTW